MVKNKIFYMLLGLFICLIPFKVNATIGFSCNDRVQSDSYFTCDVVGGSDISTVRFKVNLNSSSITYQGALPKNGFTMGGAGQNLVFTASGTNGDEIGTIKLKTPINTFAANHTYSISFDDISGTKKSGEAYTQSPVYKSIAVLTTTTTTKATTKATTAPVKKTFAVTFNVNGGSGSNTSKSCDTTSSSCVISLTDIPTPTKNGYTFAGWGSASSCTSGNTKSYTAKANTTLYACFTANNIPNNTTTSSTTTTSTTTAANQPTGTSLYLKSLSIDNQTIDFSKFKFDYELKVLYDVESLNINAEAASSDVTVTYDKPFTLIVGENTIPIVLTDANNNKTTYTIKVTRLNEGEIIKEKSSDATLSALSLGNYSVSFSPTVTNYNLEIDYKTSTINATCTPNDSNASCVIMGNTNLKTGSVIKIDVTAEDGTTNTYKINITKLSFLETYRLYFIIAASALLLLLIIIIINNKNKNKKVVPKTTVVKKTPLVKTPLTKTTVKPANTTNKPDVEVLKM